MADLSTTKLLLHLNGTQGTKDIVDSSNDARSINTSGLNALSFLDTSIKKFGVSSLKGVRSGGYCYNHLELAASTDWEPDIHNESFTYEGQFYFDQINNYGNTLIARNRIYGVGTGSWSLYIYNTGNTLAWIVGHTTVMSRSFTFSTGQFYHIRFVVDSGTAYMFVNGNLLGTSESIPSGTTFTTNTGVLTIGGSRSTSPDGIIGYYDEIRWDSRALSTSNFTPPTAEYQPDFLQKIITLV